MKATILTAVLALTALLAACSPEAQQKVQEGLQTAAPTIQAAANSAGTQVSAGIQTAAPTLQAAAKDLAQTAKTEVAGAAPTLVAGVGQLQSTMDKLTALTTEWQWQGTTMADGTERIPEDPTAYTLNIMPAGKLAIKADCNSATGSYQVTDEDLAVTLGAATLAECPEGSLYAEYLNDLSQVGSAVIDGEDLILTLKMDSGTMKFAPAQ